ncbi:MAG: precorrin-3B C(17)-methyltransferase [Methanosphaera sp.]|uniref:precorrin-3B C(17)-methyltransferase n=1 Tax=Methanosphaera sp. TaxID=2666342 RepID=UPI0025E0D55C|nr:precorrin-3B C(17)-methyltransferase [Methanosphaera sp.]MCI5866703.1 precorrin-3B C(17)-methyltransferase [Methanosphaera sp.]MDD6534218.1 precorrin-3B C(17)-methyltransferase [Methanosphaera sp.]MDY3956398.1 precorrin-3B C(17)-methyltransferase [Methanosphaera sp.]
MISLIGIGSKREHMTLKAADRIKEADVIIAYKPYLEHIEDLIEGKEVLRRGMGDEMERVELAIEKEKEGKKVAIISSGDPGIYGMANVYFQIIDKYSDLEFEVIPGVTAATYAASALGAPLHDLAIISLSDLLTPLEEIERKIEHAAIADMVIVFYNPKSKTRVEPFESACRILNENRNPETPVGIVKTEGTDTIVEICKLKDLENQDIHMSTTIIIGNSLTYVKKGKMITPRGYKTKAELPPQTEEFYEKFFNGEIREGQNTDCEYFPCHEKQENCTFCYCPIYPCGDGATNGKWITDKDVWNCKDCNWIHNDKVVDEILDFVKENIHSMEDFDRKKKQLLKLRRATIYKTRNEDYQRCFELDDE